MFIRNVLLKILEGILDSPPRGSAVHSVEIMMKNQFLFLTFNLRTTGNSCTVSRGSWIFALDRCKMIDPLN